MILYACMPHFQTTRNLATSYLLINQGYLSRIYDIMAAVRKRELRPRVPKLCTNNFKKYIHHMFKHFFNKMYQNKIYLIVR